MAYDLDLANRLRRWGLRVVEVAGWQTRGRSVPNFRGHVSHHTAGSPNGTAPSLRLVIEGGSNTAPGPLANVLQSREPDGNDIIYVIAAGTANHAGSGGWRGLTGNSSVWGNEIEHTGIEPLPDHRVEIACRVAAACVDGTAGADMTCQHHEWSSAGKIDVARDPTNSHPVDGGVWRARVAQLLAGGGSMPPIPTPEEGQKMEIVVGPIQGLPSDAAILLVGDRPVAFWPDARNAADWRKNQAAGVDLVVLTNDPYGVNARIMDAIKNGSTGPGL